MPRSAEMGTLEIVSKELFQQQLQGMSASSSSSCMGCQRERDQFLCSSGSKKQRSCRYKKPTRIVKSNSPIVVHLRDTIKVSVKGKMKSSPQSSDLESDSGSEDSGSSSPTTTSSSSSNNTAATTTTTASSATYPNSRGGGSRESSSKRFIHDAPSSGHAHLPGDHIRDHKKTRLRSRLGSSHRHGDRDLNAFLSAIEKVNAKDKTAMHNLNQDAEGVLDKDKKLLATHVLNNSLAYQSSIKNSSGGSHGSSSSSSSSSNGSSTPASLLLSTAKDTANISHANNKPCSLISSQNVKLICNDLRRISPLPGHLLAETSEDSEHSEDSSVTSLGESPSDSDISSSNRSESPADVDFLDEELSREELDHLAQYTTGCSLMRCQCPPHECHQCLQAYYVYTHYYAQGSDLFKIEVLEGEEEEAALLEPCTGSSRGAARGDSADPLVASNVVVKGPKRVEVSVAKFFGKNKKKWREIQPINTPHHSHFETVNMDLTGTDITFSVTYHTDREESPPRTGTSSASASSTTPSEAAEQEQLSQIQGYLNFYYNFYSTMMGAMPFMSPYLIPPPLPCLWTYPPVLTIPKPLCLSKDLKWPSSRFHGLAPSQDPYHFKSFTASQPPQRPWIPLSNPETSRPIAIYTVMCYNVLCDKYATRQLYGYCPSWALNWEYRKKIIIEEIRQYGADIISLQEVETEQFYHYFLPELKLDGYDGVFAAKSRARTMSEEERKHVDGCAIFYRVSKFSLIKEHLVEFNQLAISAAEGSHDMINRVMTKDNIGLAALLETKEEIWENGLPADSPVRQRILVATCHVHWDPEFCDVKLIQTMMLMAELKGIIEDNDNSLRPGSTGPHCSNIPLILCGDLNSLPDSGVVEFLSTGRVAANHEDFKDLGYQDCLRKLSVVDHKDSYSHAFKLAQAYAKDTMPYTNFTFDFKGVIDYIFFSRDYMRPLGILGPLDQEWFRENKVYGCPHPQIPSDHLPLLVEFEMAPPGSCPPVGGSSGGNPRSSSNSGSISMAGGGGGGGGGGGAGPFHIGAKR